MSSGFVKSSARVRSATVHVALADIQNDSSGRYSNLFSMGTGFFVSDDGWMLTCLHVVQQFNPNKQKIIAAFKADENTVTFSEAIGIAFQFPEIDLCAIKFEKLPERMSSIRVSSRTPEQGENIGLFGYPDSWLHYDSGGLIKAHLRPRVAKCVLSRCEIGDFVGGIKQKYLLETQFSFVKGNSGGPIFLEETGEVIGVVTGFQTFPQSAFPCAAVYNSSNKLLTGEAYNIPTFLGPGFHWEQAIGISYVTYSYGIACVEIVKYLGGKVPFSGQ